MTEPVHEVYKRWARKTRRGRLIRCNRSKHPSGPILFRVLDDARAAVAELAGLGRPHVAVPCIRGRHWHVQPVQNAEEDTGAEQAAS